MPKRNFDAVDEGEIGEEEAEPQFNPGVGEEDDTEDLDEIEEEEDY